MVAESGTGEGAAKNTGPHPITAPFDWGLGNASMPAAAALGEPAPEAAAPDDPAPDDPAPDESVPPELIAFAEPLPVFAQPVERPPEPYFTSDSDSHSESDLDPASPIDALFGETQFKDYEGEPLVGPIPTELNPFASTAAGSGAVGAGVAGAGAGGAGVGGAGVGGAASASANPVFAADRAPHTPLSKNQKRLFWVAGGIIALLVLAVLFVLGTKIPTATPPVAATSKSATPVPTPTPTPTPSPTGPAAAGVHQWGDLRGGECVDPYSSPFAQKFTVVDCAAPHPAQMVVRGTFPGVATAVYPGLESLQSQINLLCTAPRVIDLVTAGAYNDIQFQASYAATTDEWMKGQHDYFCFVNRPGGEPITGSVAGTPAK